MRRRPEIAAITLLVAALVLAALLGRATAPDRSQDDSRRSSLLAGPAGARGLADALGRLGLTVEARERSLAGVDSEPTSRLLVLLDLPEPLARTEIQAVHRYVARGGGLLVAGRSRLGACFGFSVAGTGLDSLPVRAAGASGLPFTRAFLGTTPLAEECAGLLPASTDTLLATISGRPVAVRLAYRSGGRVTLLADARFVSNRALRETAAGPVVIPWFLDAHPSAVVFDEFHQGFAIHGSLLAASARWTFDSPSGWAVLQVAAAGIVLLILAAVRFGPASAGVERRRRSPTEHLDALAAGLERARASEPAVALVVAGLRRRLGRASFAAPQPDEARRWLDTLARTARGPLAREAAGRLAAVAGAPDYPDRIVDAGNGVEDVWTALRQEEARRRS